MKMSKKNNIPIEKALSITKEVLLENNIPFEVKNNGYHFIIRTESHRYDYWPTSGKWMVDSNFKINYGGIVILMKEIDKNRVPAENGKISYGLKNLFMKDLQDMKKTELINTIEELCDFINTKFETNRRRNEKNN